jgi:hypothetical protein
MAVPTAKPILEGGWASASSVWNTGEVSFIRPDFSAWKLR